MSKKNENVNNEVVENITTNNTEKKVNATNCNYSLEELLKLEKAARVVCIKYEKMATTFEGQHNFLGYNNLEYNELQRNFKKYNEMHGKIIENIEEYLNEHYKED